MPFPFADPLPVDAVLPELRAALAAAPTAVLEAPPGAGKTTHVPLALLGADWMAGQRLLLLEPRRLAARAAAYRMADLLGESVGETVGYRMRMDTQVGPRTRIEVVTEGVLTRMLLDDPGLDGTALVVFDEFHERSLPADLGLALCREVQSVLRPDLRLLVMSATLAAEEIAAYLGGAPVVRSVGRMYPVATHYLGTARQERRIEPTVAGAVRRALDEAEGDVLVFLPGAGEIKRTAALLGDLPGRVAVHPLYGNLPREAQDRAIAPAPPGMRKIVLATSIAETSLTIEGVRVVVDSGLMRVPRFDPRSGLTRLATVPVTQDAADQRRGRAGRLAPGVCFRLWARHTPLRPHRTPEILEADLAPLALDLAAWGTTDPATLDWLDAPPPGAFAQARDLLRDLGALDAEGRLTPDGERMAALPTHPRLAHMLHRAARLDAAPLAADLAALLDERDPLHGLDGPPAPDLRLRLELLAARRRGERTGRTWHHHRIAEGPLRRAEQSARQWLKRLRIPRDAPTDPSRAGVVLALAYPDRVAQRAGPPGQFRLRDGRRAVLNDADPVAHQDFVVAASLDGRARQTRIFLAAPLTRDEIEAALGDQVVEREEVDWDRAREAVRARRVRRLDTLILAEEPLADPPEGEVARVLLEQVAERGLHVLDWSKEAVRLRERMAFLHHHLRSDNEAWPDVSDDALRATVEGWLRPFVGGMRRLSDLRRIDLVPVLRARLPWPLPRDLDALAPERLEVPSGSHVALDYSDPARPVLAVRLQEVFGLTETPRVAGGRVPLTLHLLSPAHRPVQVTQDLASFWRETYFEVRKDLRGRYPKHYWPEDPTAAVATRRTRPRR